MQLPQRYAISSFVVLLCFGFGLAVGYVAGRQQNINLIEEGVSRGYLEQNGSAYSWIHYEGFDDLKRRKERDDWMKARGLHGSDGQGSGDNEKAIGWRGHFNGNNISSRK